MSCRGRTTDVDRMARGILKPLGEYGEPQGPLGRIAGTVLGLGRQQAGCIVRERFHEADDGQQVRRAARVLRHMRQPPIAGDTAGFLGAIEIAEVIDLAIHRGLSSPAPGTPVPTHTADPARAEVSVLLIL